MGNRVQFFLTGPLLCFILSVFIVVVIIPFVAPLFFTRIINEVTNDVGLQEHFLETKTGYLFVIEVETCIIVATTERCKGDHRNIIRLDYPATIRILQVLIYSPLMQIFFFFIYWEVQRNKDKPVETIKVGVFCIIFEILHLTGFMTYTLLIGPERGFSWKDLTILYYIEICYNVFVIAVLSLKTYTSKMTYSRRRYKFRVNLTDPIYVKDQLIYCKCSQITKSKNDHSFEEAFALTSCSVGAKDTDGTESDDVYHPTSCTEKTKHKNDEDTEQKGASIYTNEALNKVNILSLDIDSEEATCIKFVVEKLWTPELAGLGRDSDAPRNIKIFVKSIKCAHNRYTLTRYNVRRQAVISFAKSARGKRKLYNPEKFGTDISAVLTDKYISESQYSNIDRDLNEHYLLHGTETSNIHSIIEKGFATIVCNRGMLGEGIYFTDHPVKADQYTGLRRNNTVDVTRCMILARVLLGNSVITKERNERICNWTSSPCRKCLKNICSHDQSDKFDSLIFDGGLFREYVVYDDSLAYPEYIIYYDYVTV